MWSYKDFHYIYIGERCPSCVIAYVRQVAIYRWLGIYIFQKEKERERERESIMWHQRCELIYTYDFLNIRL